MHVPDIPKKTETYTAQIKRKKQEEQAKQKRIDRQNTLEFFQRSVPDTPSKASGWVVMGGTAAAFTILVGMGAYETNCYGLFDSFNESAKEIVVPAPQYGEHFEIK